jgi:hypothetical protein
VNARCCRRYRPVIVRHGISSQSVFRTCRIFDTILNNQGTYQKESQYERRNRCTEKRIGKCLVWGISFLSENTPGVFRIGPAVLHVSRLPGEWAHRV